jgi:hypothetical protein
MGQDPKAAGAIKIVGVCIGSSLIATCALGLWIHWIPVLLGILVGGWACQAMGE